MTIIGPTGPTGYTTSTGPTGIDNVALEEQIRREHMNELRRATCWVAAIVLWIVVGTIVKYTAYDLSWLIVLLPVLVIAVFLLISFIGFITLSFAAYSVRENVNE